MNSKAAIIGLLFSIMFLVFGLPIIGIFCGDSNLRELLGNIAGSAFMSYFLGAIGMLHGLSFALGILVKHHNKIKRIKTIFIIIPFISGTSLVHEILSYIVSPTIEIGIISDILNGVGVWGGVGVTLTLVTLSFDVFSRSIDDDARDIGRFASFIALLGVVITVGSGITHKYPPLWSTLPLTVFNTCSYVTFYLAARSYLKEEEQ
jgi:ABC-type sugar transport system permease subunit